MAKYFKVVRRNLSGGSFIWEDGSPASIIYNNEFFEQISSGTTYDETITLTTDNTIVPSVNLIIEDIISLLTDNSINTLGSLVFEDAITLTTNNTIDSFDELEFFFKIKNILYVKNINKLIS